MGSPMQYRAVLSLVWAHREPAKPRQLSVSPLQRCLQDKDPRLSRGLQGPL